MRYWLLVIKYWMLGDSWDGAKKYAAVVTEWTR